MGLNNNKLDLNVKKWLNSAGCCFLTELPWHCSESMEQGTGWPAKRKKNKPCCQGGTSDCHDMAWVWTYIWCIPKMNGWCHELSCFFVDAKIKEDWTIYPHVAVETSYTEVVGRKAMAKAKTKSASKAGGWRWRSISRWCDRFMCVVVNRYKPLVFGMVCLYPWEVTGNCHGHGVGTCERPLWWEAKLWRRGQLW